uniref:Uncharacterized protein n=1 Tax=Anguilla anguilla TaxID=7936 RepID=A0A0E9PVD3_ANGAN
MLAKPADLSNKALLTMLAMLCKPR